MVLESTLILRRGACAREFGSLSDRALRRRALRLESEFRRVQISDSARASRSCGADRAWAQTRESRARTSPPRPIRDEVLGANFYRRLRRLHVDGVTVGVLGPGSVRAHLGIGCNSKDAGKREAKRARRRRESELSRVVRAAPAEGALHRNRRSQR